MTTARFEQSGDHFTVVVFGHAGYNTEGPDIVCAACSTLTCTLLQSILALEAEGLLRAFPKDGVRAHFLAGDGDFGLSFWTSVQAREKAETVVQVIISGFALLQEKYPDFVNLSVKNGEK